VISRLYLFFDILTKRKKSSVIGTIEVVINARFISQNRRIIMQNQAAIVNQLYELILKKYVYSTQQVKQDYLLQNLT
jgi:hypothetical protein